MVFATLEETEISQPRQVQKRAAAQKEVFKSDAEFRKPLFAEALTN